MMLDDVLIQADALHTTRSLFCWCLDQGADVVLTVKSNQPKLYRQIGCQVEGTRKIPFTPMAHEKRHGGD
jgi:hypothetical protein